VAATATAATCKAQEAAAAAGGSTSGAQQVSGVEELHLGCGCDHVDTAWLHSSSAVTSSHIIGLLQGACQVGVLRSGIGQAYWHTTRNVPLWDTCRSGAGQA
jgi:hypothetical protein